MRKFDKQSKSGYDVQDLNFMKDDMGQLFEKILKQYTETKCGSDRSQVLLDAICKRLPKLYREMIDDYRKGAKK